MATNFPTSLDNISVSTGFRTKVDAPSAVFNPGLNTTIFARDTNDLRDAIIALETKVGVNSSVDTTCLDYKVSSHTLLLSTLQTVVQTTATGLTSHAGNNALHNNFSALYLLDTTTQVNANGSNRINLSAGTGISLTATASDTIEISTFAGGVSHSDLLNLSSDDHLQYLNTARHGAITGNPHGTSLSDIGAVGSLYLLGTGSSVTPSLSDRIIIDQGIHLNITSPVVNTVKIDLSNSASTMLTQLASHAISLASPGHQLLEITPTANYNIGGFKITNLGTPTDPSDAVTKNYVDMISGGSTSTQMVMTESQTQTTNINTPTTIQVTPPHYLIPSTLRILRLIFQGNTVGASTTCEVTLEVLDSNNVVLATTIATTADTPVVTVASSAGPFTVPLNGIVFFKASYRRTGTIGNVNVYGLRAFVE